MVSCTLVFGTILFFIEGKFTWLTWFENIFMAASALTETGLTLRDLSRMSLLYNLTIIIISFFGNICFISILPVLVRMHIMRKKSKFIEKEMNNKDRGRIQGKYKYLGANHIVYPLVKQHRQISDNYVAPVFNRSEPMRGPKSNSLFKFPITDIRRRLDDDSSEQKIVNKNTASLSVYTNKEGEFTPVISSNVSSSSAYNLNLINTQNFSNESSCPLIRQGDGNDSSTLKEPTSCLLQESVTCEAKSDFIDESSTDSDPVEYDFVNIDRITNFKESIVILIEDPTIDNTNLLTYNISMEENPLKLSLGRSVSMVSEIHWYERSVEYLAMKQIVINVLLYVLLNCLIGAIILYIILTFIPSNSVLSRREGWDSNLFTAFFTSCSCFNNLGMMIFSSGYGPFNHSPFVLFICSFLVVVGNTLYPVFLRLIIKFRYRNSLSYKMVFEKLLESPREIFTHLFPKYQTVFLVICWFIFTIWTMSMFAIFDSGSEMLNDYKWYEIIFIDLFTCVSTRCSGTSSIDLSQLSIATNTVFILMMILAPFPFIYSLFKTTIREKNAISNKKLAVSNEILNEDNTLSIEDAINDKRLRDSITVLSENITQDSDEERKNNRKNIKSQSSQSTYAYSPDLGNTSIGENNGKNGDNKISLASHNTYNQQGNQNDISIKNDSSITSSYDSTLTPTTSIDSSDEQMKYFGKQAVYYINDDLPQNTVKKIDSIEKSTRSSNKADSFTLLKNAKKRLHKNNTDKDKKQGKNETKKIRFDEQNGIINLFNTYDVYNFPARDNETLIPITKEKVENDNEYRYKQQRETSSDSTSSELQRSSGSTYSYSDTSSYDITETSSETYTSEDSSTFITSVGDSQSMQNYCEPYITPEYDFKKRSMCRERTKRLFKRFANAYREETIVRDLVLLWFAWFFIIMIEQNEMEKDYENHNPYILLFELSSAYGNIGLSLGRKGTTCSYCATLKVSSQFILVLIFLLGKHRGLPLAVDAAVNLDNIISTDEIMSISVKDSSPYDEFIMNDIGKMMCI